MSHAELFLSLPLDDDVDYKDENDDDDDEMVGGTPPPPPKGSEDRKCFPLFFGVPEGGCQTSHTARMDHLRLTLCSGSFWCFSDSFSRPVLLLLTFCLRWM